MKNNKGIKKTVLLSALAAIAFGTVAVTTSYALFTDTSETNVTVSAGKVDVSATASELKLSSLDEDRTEDGSFSNGGTATIDGTSIVLSNITPGDKVTFKIDVKNNSTVSTKYRTRVVAEEDTGLYDGLKFTIAGLSSMGITEWTTLDTSTTDLGSYECSIELPKEAGNEYQGMSCKLSYVVEAVQGNAEVKNDTKYYTLEQFNALTEIDEEVENIYLHLGKQSLAENDVIIGSDNLKDTEAFYNNLSQDTLNGKTLTVDDLVVGTVLDSGLKITGVDEQNQYHTITQKHGADIYVSGSISGGVDVEKPNLDAKALKLLLPSECKVLFENFKASGYLRVNTDSLSANKLESITFKNSTFNGVIQQVAKIYTKELVFDGCTFNNYINSASPTDSNPIWIQTPYNLNFTMNNCTINSSRPIKIVEGTVTGNYTFTNNIFDVSYENSGDEIEEDKHAGIVFESSTELGNVVVSGNTLTKGTALIAFRRSGNEGSYTTKIVRKEGATFKVYDNTLNEGVLSTYWKGNTYWVPDFVTLSA